MDVTTGFHKPEKFSDFKMSLKVAVLILIVQTIAIGVTLAEFTPSKDQYLFTDLIPFLNATKFLLDGPACVSYAPTTPTTNKKPTLDQMMYYNYYSASMYCQYEINDLSCKYCQKFKKDVATHKVLMNNDTIVTAMITLSHKRKEIVVTYRGSQNPWNFVLDFTLLRMCYNYPECDIKLHVGLYILTTSLYDEVIANVGDLLRSNPNYKIVINGHSLGGAMARMTTFFILFLKQFPGTDLELYTYGEPRVGNKGFADFMNTQNITTARVTARADFAPHIMPVSTFGTNLLGDFFIHPQPEYWINGIDDQKFADTSRYNDPNCSDSMGPAVSVLDHFQYFEVNYLVCYTNQLLVWSALPENILQPVGTIPPLPTKISDFVGDKVGLASDLTRGTLG